MIGVILYQVHSIYISESSLWLKFTQCLRSLRNKQEDVLDASDDERAPFIFRPEREALGSRLRESLLEEY